MSRQQDFEAIYAKQHDVPAESLVQYRFESKEGYSLPGISSHYRFYCLAMDSEEIQALRKDAERYRFLRQDISNNVQDFCIVKKRWSATFPDRILELDGADAEIDAAMTKGAKP